MRFVDPKPIGGMLEDTLRRHGIALQVSAAQIVSRANLVLAELLPAHARADILAASYREGTLTLFCKHAPGKMAAETIGEGLRAKLEEQFPRLTLKQVACVLRPQVFSANDGRNLVE